MATLLIFVLSFIPDILVIVNAAGKGYGVEWSYNKDSNINPGNWSRHYPDCGKKKQSPINILTRDVRYHRFLGNLELKNYKYEGDDLYFNVKNRNTDIAFMPKTNKGIQVPQQVEFQGTTYRFAQFHFHWGSKNYQGSEHLLDWQQFAGEMHIIHYNTKYKDLGAAAPNKDGLLVWGHFLKVDSVNMVKNKGFDQLLSHFSKALSCCDEIKIDAFSLFDLLPKKHRDFYHYKGSLTTPPCYESVKWIIDRNPISVSEEQMKKFRKLRDTAISKTNSPKEKNAPSKEKYIGDNNRPPQPLNDREVQCNFDPSVKQVILMDDQGSGKKGAGSITKPFYMSLLSLVVLVIFVV